LLAGLFHDIGKAYVQSKDPEGNIHFYMEDPNDPEKELTHEDVGAKIAGEILSRLRFDDKTIAKVKRLIEEHMTLHAKDALRESTLKELYNLFGGEIEPLLQLTEADIAGRKGPEHPSHFPEMKETLMKIKETPPPAEALIDGKKIMEILGVSPGPIIGQVKEELKQQQYEDKITTPEQAEEYVRSNAERFKVGLVKPGSLTMTEILCNV
jgi:tRNA nucleotidyltransferase/poly(A) polymerase